MGIIIFHLQTFFRGIIDYKKSKKISDLVKPYTEIGFGGTLSFFNTYVIDYEYTNVKYGELGESSDKYRTIEEHTYWLSFGIILDL